jgi:asparagine synthase (glutamine-hydrolysing)
MCGIVGIVNQDTGNQANERLVRDMAGSLAHRGPDDEGFYFNGRVALGMRRLAIIDLPGGHQPICNEDRRIWVVFNGEIYNFAELRGSLESSGHKFATDSDTEVLVHLYEEFGDEMVTHLNGMFAFTLWDEARERLLAARDRMGEKPFYYSLTAEAFVFASELKALLLHPAIGRRLDLDSLRKYLFYEFVPSPHTMIEGVNKLPPAHRLIWEKNRVRTERYWQIGTTAPPISISEGEAVEEVRERFGDAVRRRLIADVPLGVLLSGGIDSSSVAALACQAASGRVKTFSIGFAEPSFDESSYAREVAAHLGTEHYEHRFTEKQMLDIVPEIPRLLDEPLGDGSLIPTYLLSRFARTRVTVALGGDGGDELFAGYPTYLAHRMSGYYRSLPAAVRRGLIEPVVARLPVSTDNLSFDFRAKRFVRGAALPAGTRHATWMGSFDPTEQRKLLNPEVLAASPDGQVFGEIRAFDETNGDVIERMMRLDASQYLPECVLFKVDRASMAASLEVRAPFLDHTLVEFVTSLPIGLKLRGLTTKYILKRAMQGYLPAKVTHRAKKGFGMPVARWVNKELRPLVRDTFAPERMRRRGLFNAEYVQRLLAEHSAGRADHRKLIWTLLMFEMWPAGQ